MKKLLIITMLTLFLAGCEQVDLSGITGDIDTIDTSIEDVREDIDSLTEDIDTLTDNLGDLTITQLEEELAFISTELSFIRNLITDLDTEIAINQGDIITISGSVLSVIEDIDLINTEIELLETSITHLQTSITSINQELISLQTELTELQDDTSLQDQIDAMNVVITALQNEVNLLTDDYTLTELEINTIIDNLGLYISNDVSIFQFIDLPLNSTTNTCDNLTHDDGYEVCFYGNELPYAFDVSFANMKSIFDDFRGYAVTISGPLSNIDEYDENPLFAGHEIVSDTLYIEARNDNSIYIKGMFQGEEVAIAIAQDTETNNFIIEAKLDMTLGFIEELRMRFVLSESYEVIEAHVLKNQTDEINTLYIFINNDEETSFTTLEHYYTMYHLEKENDLLILKESLMIHQPGTRSSYSIYDNEGLIVSFVEVDPIIGITIPVNGFTDIQEIAVDPFVSLVDEYILREDGTEYINANGTTTGEPYMGIDNLYRAHEVNNTLGYVLDEMIVFYNDEFNIEEVETKYGITFKLDTTDIYTDVTYHFDYQIAISSNPNITVGYELLYTIFELKD